MEPSKAITFPVNVPGFAATGEYRLPKDGDTHYLRANGEAGRIDFVSEIPTIILTEINKEYKTALRKVPLKDGWVVQSPSGYMFWSASEPSLVDGSMVDDDDRDDWTSKGGFVPLKPILDFYELIVPQVDDWRTSKIQVYKPFNPFG